MIPIASVEAEPDTMRQRIPGPLEDESARHLGDSGQSHRPTERKSIRGMRHGQGQKSFTTELVEATTQSLVFQAIKATMKKMMRRPVMLRAVLVPERLYFLPGSTRGFARKESGTSITIDENLNKPSLYPSGRTLLRLARGPILALLWEREQRQRRTQEKRMWRSYHATLFARDAHALQNSLHRWVPESRPGPSARMSPALYAM